MRLRLHIIGRGAYVQSTKAGVNQCAIGIDESIGLVRIWPIPLMRLCQWDTVECCGESCRQDTRHNTFRVSQETGSITVVGKYGERGQQIALIEQCELMSGDADPIDYGNENMFSMMIVRPQSIAGGIDFNDSQQLRKHDTYIWTQQESEIIPRINWRSVQGKSHCNKLVAHEAWEWMRKNPNRPSQLFDNLRIYDPDYDKFILLGNQKEHRNAWVAVHVHRWKKKDQRTIPGLSPTQDGRPKGWPYSRSEDANVKPAAPQFEFSFTTSSTT